MAPTRGRGPRRPNENAAPLAGFLGDLADIDPMHSGWRPTADSRSVSAVTVEVDQASLSQLMKAGRNRRDVGGEVVEDLGYALALRTGPDPVISLRATVGGTVASVSNNVLIAVPARGPRPRPRIGHRSPNF